MLGYIGKRLIVLIVRAHNNISAYRTTHITLWPMPVRRDTQSSQFVDNVTVDNVTEKVTNGCGEVVYRVLKIVW